MFTNDSPSRLNIPQDICDEILYHLRFDIRSLKRISLVCNAWSLSTRRYLFSLLIVREENMKTLSVTPASKTPYLSMASYVRKLEIHQAEHLDQISPDSIISSISSTITWLSLVNCSFHSFEELLNFVRTFPSLKGISLQDVDCVHYLNVSQHSSIDWRPLRSSIRQIRLINAPIKYIVGWLCNQPKLPCFSSLEVGPLRGQDALFYSQILLRSALTLQHLALHFDTEEEKEETYVYLMYGTTLPARSCPITPDSEVLKLYKEMFGVPLVDMKTAFCALHTLRVNKFYDSSRKVQSTACHWMPRLLTKIGSSGSLIHIIVQIDVARAGEFDKHNIPWDFYDQALSCGTFRNLLFWEFEVVGRAPVDAISDILSLRLPRLAVRGLLRFSKAG